MNVSDTGPRRGAIFMALWHTVFRMQTSWREAAQGEVAAFFCILLPNTLKDAVKLQDRQSIERTLARATSSAQFPIMMVTDRPQLEGCAGTGSTSRTGIAT